MGGEFRLVMSGHGRGEAFIDGVKVPGVFEVSVSVGVDKTNQVTLKVHAENIEVSGEFDVTTIDSVEKC